ncbi:serine--glyoxylate aminotransferase [Gossypium australe]|uniref:Serine--glyoxylate aminotransferase n=1 Tax=Gossypium australe TaxID=47621 RepID=A0A5B6WY76_9ROSI|nr:serine--glyoxylate aminotransferase [Gossypium australe]
MEPHLFSARASLFLQHFPHSCTDSGGRRKHGITIEGVEAHDAEGVATWLDGAAGGTRLLLGFLLLFCFRLFGLV